MQVASMQLAWVNGTMDGHALGTLSGTSMGFATRFESDLCFFWRFSAQVWGCSEAESCLQLELLYIKQFKQNMVPYYSQE